ncbi:hypothetical protein H5410_035172 [Solanum commersonii]|uniref:Uncharacterized protein n=1 Tax=Solanum commersonii TaxID=4109 RepID=A0A9J5Y3U8_SOLCO|nr:hypothetical protein H5410_035172 [Solanum commersonii]
MPSILIPEPIITGFIEMIIFLVLFLYVQIDTLLACGGLAKNRLFVQEHADIIVLVDAGKSRQSLLNILVDTNAKNQNLHNILAGFPLEQYNDYASVPSKLGRLNKNSLLPVVEPRSVGYHHDGREYSPVYYNNLVNSPGTVNSYPIILPRENESVLLGSAILGAVASKKYPTVRDAMKAMNAAGQVVHPSKDMKVKKYHDAKYSIFRDLYEQQQKHRSLMADALS